VENVNIWYIFNSWGVYWLIFRGIIDPKADIWRNLLIPLKIKMFMWLVLHNKILTRDNLCKRGWNKDLHYTMYSEQESISHVFFICHMAKQIWFWMCQSQNYFIHWHTMKDVLEFALSLSPLLQKNFLIVLSAVCWSLWRHKNSIVFNSTRFTSDRSLICLILSLVNYWVGVLYCFGA
jgi:zinc-binding in reverse transcriptase